MVEMKSGGLKVTGYLSLPRGGRLRIRACHLPHTGPDLCEPWDLDDSAFPQTADTGSPPPDGELSGSESQIRK